MIRFNREEKFSSALMCYSSSLSIAIVGGICTRLMHVDRIGYLTKLSISEEFKRKYLSRT